MRRNRNLTYLARVMEKCNSLELLCNRVVNHYACCIEEMTDDVIAQIQILLDKPEIRSCRIPLIVDFAHMTKPDYWLDCEIFNKISKEKAKVMESKLEVMAHMLKALELKVKKVNPVYAEKMITRMMSLCQKNIKITDYDIWKAEHSDPTPEMLLNLQIKLTSNMLLAGALKHDEKPTEKEMKEVRVDKVLEGLEHGKELPPDFAEECAKLRRYSYWIGKYIFMIDYRKIYRYLFMHCFDKLTKQQRLALFEYDVQMKQIHEDLERLLNGKMAEQQQTEQQDEQPQTEDLGELNFFAPAKSIKTMLQGEWLFYQRTDVKYTKDWMEAFVDALMESELGVLIAKEWQMKKKRERLKGNIIGCLRESGVLKGSYDTLAKNVGKEGRTFSRYICDGKKQPFNDWIMAYVGR